MNMREMVWVSLDLLEANFRVSIGGGSVLPTQWKTVSRACQGPYFVPVRVMVLADLCRKFFGSPVLANL